MAAMLKISVSNFTARGHSLGGGRPNNNKVRSVVTLPKSKRGYSGACRIEVVAAGRQGGAATASKTLCKVLGVDANESSPDDIKQAYKNLARRYHPNTNWPEDHEACTQKFLEVRNAYEVLSDPNKRVEYDFAMANPMLAQAYGNSSWSRGSPHRGDALIRGGSSGRPNFPGSPVRRKATGKGARRRRHGER